MTEDWFENAIYWEDIIVFADLPLNHGTNTQGN